jgi:acyl-coenzyme A thioesterase PaaI-like protein
VGPSEQTTPPPSAVAPQRDPKAPAPGTVLGAHYARCFGCGDEHETGLRLQMTVQEGVAVHCEFTVTEHHMGAPGLAHGGVLASALDEALGSLAWLMLTPAVTARLEVDYLTPVPVGRTVVIDARCTGVDGRKVYVEGVGRLDSSEGPVAIRGAGLFIAVPFEHFARHGGREQDILPGRFNP